MQGFRVRGFGVRVCQFHVAGFGLRLLWAWDHQRRRHQFGVLISQPTMSAPFSTICIRITSSVGMMLNRNSHITVGATVVVVVVAAVGAVVAVGGLGFQSL